MRRSPLLALACLAALLGAAPLHADDDVYEAYRKIRWSGRGVSGEFRIALWCKARGLTSEMLYHLERVLEMDPDHGFARRIYERYVPPKPRATPPPRLDSRGRPVVVVGIADPAPTGVVIDRGRRTGPERVQVGLDPRGTTGARFGEGRTRRWQVGKIDVGKVGGIVIGQGRTVRFPVGKLDPGNVRGIVVGRGQALRYPIGVLRRP